jgi:hypothetical protein
MGAHMMTNDQMELSFERANGSRSITRRQRRLTRAQWWFDRMREVVDRAVDWAPLPAPRPEQIWFPNTFRQPGTALAHAAALPKSEQHQVCE